MERRCRELAAGAASLEERDALLELAGSYRAATQAPPTSKLPVARDRQFSAKSLRLLGRSGRARTCDPRFWSSGGIVSSGAAQFVCVMKTSDPARRLVQPVHLVRPRAFASGSKVGSKIYAGHAIGRPQPDSSPPSPAGRRAQAVARPPRPPAPGRCAPCARARRRRADVAPWADQTPAVRHSSRVLIRIFPAYRTPAE